MQAFVWFFLVSCGAVVVLSAGAAWVTRPDRPLEALGPVRRFVRETLFPRIDATPEGRERLERARAARHEAAMHDRLVSAILNAPGRRP